MESKPKPVKRSVSLSQSTNNDLVTLTDLLGVNAHSYMVNEIAKAVQRDLLVYKSTKDTSTQLSGFIEALQSVMNDEQPKD